MLNEDTKVKNLFIAVLSLLFISSAYANTPSLQIKISGETQNKNYFLCIANVGCLSLIAAKHKIFPIESGRISYIFTANGKNYQMFPQSLPKSCDIVLNDNEILTISGELRENKKKVRINYLNCSIKKG